MRTIAIGDIHGCAAALFALLELVEPRPEDTVVTLGDYVDRGPDSRGVIEQLLALGRRCRLVPILGNHDELLLELVNTGGRNFDFWLAWGGNTTLASYGARLPEELPAEHVAFLRSCAAWHQTDGHLFFHAGYEPELPLEKQPAGALRWNSLRDGVPRPHRSGKRAVVGHTSQHSGEVLDLGHIVCIDTRCYAGLWLTALEVETGRIWQVDPMGRPRER